MKNNRVNILNNTELKYTNMSYWYATKAEAVSYTHLDVYKRQAYTTVHRKYIETIFWSIRFLLVRVAD